MRSALRAVLVAAKLLGCGPPDGSVPNGGSCSRDRHCQSGNCDADTGGSGICIPRCIPIGNACSSGGCCEGLYCSQTQGSCQRF
jgi:hypothetical protein